MDPARTRRDARLPRARSHGATLSRLFARLASSFEPDEGTVRTELEHVPLAQDGVENGLAVDPRLRPRVRALEHDLALALEDERVPRRGSRRAHVGVGAGTEHRGQRHLVHFAASWPREMPEPDPGGHAGVAQRAAEASTPGATVRSASAGRDDMGRFYRPTLMATKAAREA